MQDNDRKLVWAGLAIFAIIAAEFAWFLFIGPAQGQPTCGTSNTPQCDLPWWDSAAFWTAFFTCALTGSTGLLWWTTRDTLGHAREDAERQSRDMATSLTIAKQAADAAVAGQRPWLKISISIASDLVKRSGNAYLEFAVVIENIGHSPATNVEIWVPMICGGTGFDWQDGINKIPPTPEHVGISLFPNQPQTITTWGMLTEEEINAALAEAQSTHHINIGMVASAAYRFAGGHGSTQKLYRLIGPHFLQTVDMRKLPVARGELSIEATPVGDALT